LRASGQTRRFQDRRRWPHHADALTHDPKIDDPALIYALSSDAFYVALESKKMHAKRRRG
jgi:xanthine/CO dehydrogenase XdhC/CoxF family maturation factor